MWFYDAEFLKCPDCCVTFLRKDKSPNLIHDKKVIKVSSNYSDTTTTFVLLP